MTLACAHTGPETPVVGLLATVSELQLHLRDDPYRSFGYIGKDGRNFFEVTRWRIERLQRERSVAPEGWQADDFVLEFARARSLERLHQYRDAADAYVRVANGDTPLRDSAATSASVMQSFAQYTGGVTWGLTPSDLDAELNQRARAWRDLSADMSDPSYAALAREEAESWEVLRVQSLAAHQGIEEALLACEELVERHRQSKLYPKHLLLLGNLHAEVARGIVSELRAARGPIEGSDYERHFAAAVAAYELASESRVDTFRREARGSIQALMAYHEGVLNGVYD